MNEFFFDQTSSSKLKIIEKIYVIKKNVMRDNSEQYSKEDEVTLREIILGVQGFIKEVLKYWYVVLLASLIGGAIQYYKVTHQDILYKADVRFVVEGEKGSGGGLSSLLGTFGIKQGGNVNPYKLKEVARSSSTLKIVLSEKLEGGEMIANSIISKYKLDEKLGKNRPEMLGFRYKKSLVNRELNEIERKVLRKLQKIVWGSDKGSEKALLEINYNENTGIHNIVAKTIDEPLSLKLSTEIYEQVRLFFEDKVFQNQKLLTDILKSKADSLMVLRDQKIMQLARFRDRNRQLLSATKLADQTIITQDQVAISAAIMEVVKNKEMTDVNLKSIQPLFMPIDYPFAPLPQIEPSFTLQILIGLIIGGLAVASIILLLKMYRETMYSDKQT